MEVSWGFTARRGVHPGQQQGEEVKQGDGQLRGARCGRRRAPACLPGRSSSLERCWAGPAGGLASGPAVAPGRVFPFFSISVFI